MKRLRVILTYVRPYRFKVFLNISFNLLSVIFSLFSVTMAIPFLGILFKTQDPVTSVESFTMSAESVQQHFYYFLSGVIEREGEVRALVYISLILVLMTLLKTGFRYMGQYHMAAIRNGVIRDIRNRIYDKILQLPLSYYSDERKGDIMARVTDDVKEIETSIVVSIEALLRDPITIIIYLSALTFTSPQLTLFVAVLLPVSGYIIGRLGKSLKRRSKRAQDKMGELLSIIEETISGLRIVKAFSAEQQMQKRFQNENNSYKDLLVSVIRRHAMGSPLSEFLGTVVMVLIMYYGSSLVLNQSSDLSPQAFIGYLVMFYLIIAPAKAFSTASYNVRKGMASSERVNAILKADNKITEKADAKRIQKFEDRIVYDQVSFRYVEEAVLKNINLTIKEGQSIALVGQSGSGKSTLVDLLPRFYDVQEGTISIDGIAITDYRLADLRALMGIVSQESILFNDTIFNNIAFGISHATQADVEAAAKIANAHEFILETPNGYQTNIGDSGSKLSGGQRQRLSIARAVLKNPPILILDEATSALDSESERLVQDALDKLLQSRTSIVIAHRLSTIRNVDEICVMHEGRIVERGTHQTLIQRNGHYKKLVDLQKFT